MDAACSDAGCFSPFAGRILDWYSMAEGKSFTAETDPGVLPVRQTYNLCEAATAMPILVRGSLHTLFNAFDARTGHSRVRHNAGG